MDANKNLGIVIMKRKDCIEPNLIEQLLQTDVYEKLSYTRTRHRMKQVEREIKKNTILQNNPELSTSDMKFCTRGFQLKHRTPTFCIIPKLHKRKTGECYKTRPVVSKIGSFIEIVSKFCDHYVSRLIPYVQSYVKNSFTLLKDLNNIQELPSATKLITTDDMFMYTNIDTNHGLQILSNFIHAIRHHIPYSQSNQILSSNHGKKYFYFW